MKKVKIGMLGLGTVGSGVYKTLKRFDNVEIVKISVKNIDKPRNIEGLDESILTTDVYSIINDPEIDIFVEVIGGVNPAWEYISAAIKAGKHIVTANKELLAKKGKELFDYAQTIARIAFAQRKNKTKSKEVEDIMWYLWCSANSPLFGKDKAATFERYFIDDKEPHKEIKDPYFKLVESKEICEKILKEFGIEDEDSHIINGHMPVKEKNGESPIRAEGKLLVIDGGFAKSYRSQTGRAGYTLTYNSHGLVLSANEPFDSKDDAIRNEIDIKYDIMVNENKVERKSVGDTDIGIKLKKEIKNLKLLIDAYREGIIKEKK